MAEGFKFRFDPVGVSKLFRLTLELDLLAALAILERMAEVAASAATRRQLSSSPGSMLRAAVVELEFVSAEP